jgi:hypothetical protein
MSKTTTLAHITSLALTSDNIQTSIGEHYDDLVIALGRTGFLGTALALQSVATQRRYAAGASVTALLGVFYNTTFLPRHTLRDLETISADWRADTDATPLAVAFDTEVPNTFTLYPDPVAGSNAPSGAFATAFGSGFEANQLSLLCTTHPTNVDAFLEPYLHYAVLALELNRESHHTNPEVAALATQFADILLTMLS